MVLIQPRKTGNCPEMTYFHAPILIALLYLLPDIQHQPRKWQWQTLLWKHSLL